MLPAVLVLAGGLGLVSDSTVGFIDTPAGVQRVYTRGVPHTDRQGRRRLAYDPATSFLPLVIYNPQLDCGPHSHAAADELGQQCLPQGTDASVYTKANFTATLPYHGEALDTAVSGFARHNLQVIVQGFPDNATLRRYSDHPAILGWYLFEEPTGTQCDGTAPSPCPRIA